MNGNMQPHYLLEFPGSDSEASSITIVATGETANASTPMTQNCTQIRKLWVFRSNGVISGGSGFIPGKKEVVRLKDGKNTKNVAVALMSTEPADDNASFTIYRSKTRFSSMVDVVALLFISNETVTDQSSILFPCIFVTKPVSLPFE